MEQIIEKPSTSEYWWIVSIKKIRKVIEKAISRRYAKQKYFSHIIDKSVLLRRNSLKALVIMPLFLLLLLLLFVA